MNTHGTLNLKDILPIAIMLLVVAIGVSIGSQITSDIAEDQCATGYTWDPANNRCENSTGGHALGAGETHSSNVSRFGATGLGEFGSWLPTIGLIVAAAIVIGVLVGAFGRR